MSGSKVGHKFRGNQYTDADMKEMVTDAQTDLEAHGLKPSAEDLIEHLHANFGKRFKVEQIWPHMAIKKK